MSTIFLLRGPEAEHQGDSDGPIYGVFSTEQKAKDARALFPIHSDAVIQPLTLDHVPTFPAGLLPYGVFIKRSSQYDHDGDGKTNPSYRTNRQAIYWDSSPVDTWSKRYDDLIYFHIWATDLNDAETKAKAMFWAKGLNAKPRVKDQS